MGGEQNWVEISKTSQGQIEEIADELQKGREEIEASNAHVVEGNESVDEGVSKDSETPNLDESRLIAGSPRTIDRESEVFSQPCITLPMILYELN